MNLIEYVREHTERSACRCGSCIDGGQGPELTGHTANMVFFDVTATNDPTAEELRALIKSHEGIHAQCDPLDGKEHSHRELSLWLDDQGKALQLMGLGSLLGLWKLLTPYTEFGFDIPHEYAIGMAQAGLISITATPYSPA